jgi:hypothetical protein
LRKRGDLTGARALLGRVRDMGMDGGDVADLLMQEGLLAFAAGDRAGAERAVRECVEVRVRLLGDGHVSVGKARAVLAGLAVR